MRDPVGEVDCAVDGVDNPAILGILLPGDAFLAQYSNLRKAMLKSLLNQLLAANVQFELNVMLGNGFSPLAGVEVATHQDSGRSSRPGRDALRPPQIKVVALVS